MQEIERKDKQYVWHPFTQMKDWVASPQLTIAAAKGIKLIDTDGKEYYDGVFRCGLISTVIATPRLIRLSSISWDGWLILRCLG